MTQLLAVVDHLAANGAAGLLHNTEVGRAATGIHDVKCVPAALIAVRLHL